MRVLLVAVLLSASLCAALPPRFRSTTLADCQAAKGDCLGPTECGAGQQIKGQCPGSKVCCIPNERVSACANAGGKCDDKVNGCAGTWKSGLCPGKFVCCVAGAGQQAPAPTPSAPAPPAPKPQAQAETGGAVPAKLLCMSFDDGPFDVSFPLAEQMAANGVPSMFYVNCHKGWGRRGDWVKLIKDKGHTIGNHMCEHDIMAQSHYTKMYNSMQKKSDGCLNNAAQRATFRTHVQDNFVLWKEAGIEMKTARLNGDGRFNPCVVKYVENPQTEYPDNPGTKQAFEGLVSQKHVGWQFEIGPTMVKGSTKAVMGHITFPTGITHNGHTLFATDTKPPVQGGKVVLAHDLHYAADDKVTLLVKWIQKIKADGYTFGIINNQGKCVPGARYE